MRDASGASWYIPLLTRADSNCSICCPLPAIVLLLLLTSCPTRDCQSALIASAECCAEWDGERRKEMTGLANSSTHFFHVIMIGERFGSSVGRVVDKG